MATNWNALILASVVSAVVSAAVTFLLSWVLRYRERERNTLDAASMLRNELIRNESWLADALDTLNYLRDDSFKNLKKDVSELPGDLQVSLNDTYECMHRFNRYIRMLHHPDDYDVGEFNRATAEAVRNELKVRLQNTLLVLDKTFPRVRRRYLASGGGN